jgi:hypothetical protein
VLVGTVTAAPWSRMSTASTCIPAHWGPGATPRGPCVSERAVVQHGADPLAEGTRDGCRQPSHQGRGDGMCEHDTGACAGRRLICLTWKRTSISPPHRHDEFLRLLVDISTTSPLGASGRRRSTRSTPTRRRRRHELLVHEHAISSAYAVPMITADGTREAYAARWRAR